MLAGKTRAKAGVVLASMLMGSCLAGSCSTQLQQTLLEGIQGYWADAATPTLNDDTSSCGCLVQEDE